MKLRILAFMLVIALMLPVAAQALTPRAISASPSLSFNGTTASCSVRILSGNFSDEIIATIKLCYGDNVAATWHRTASGYLFFTDSIAVVSGRTYQLVVDYTVNGETMTTAWVENTCP